jgi:hypothetical protein
MTENPEMRSAAARYVLGVATGRDLVRAADSLMDQGIVTPSLVELATCCDPIMSDAGPLFEKALSELREQLPDRDTATWHLVRQHIGKIACGETPPREGVAALVREVEQNSRSTLRSIRYVGDSHDLQDLIGAYYGLDDLGDRPNEVSYEGKYGQEAIQALQHHMVDLAREWIAKHGK